MDAKRPNLPGGRSPDENVRRLQGRLRDVAKQQPGRRFHALYDRIYRSDVLYEAWNAVRRNQGSAGVDAQTIAEIEQYGVERFLEELADVLKNNEYRPQAVLRRYIPNADGKQRPLGIPTVRDRVVQAATKLILEPIFEVDFRDCSYPQGGVISPLLSNIYLSFLDDEWHKRHARLGVLVRYADDFAVICKTAQDCREAERGVKKILTELELELHPEKTRRVELSWGKQSFDFLGCTLRKRFSGPVWMESGKRLYFLQRCPSTKSMKRVRQRAKDLTPRSRCHQDPRDVIAALNPVLRGWGQYFRTGNATENFGSLDAYVAWRLKRLRVSRKGRHLKPGESRRWNSRYFYALGLHHLVGSIKYPEAV